MIFFAFLHALFDLLNPKALKILAKGIGLALLLLATLYVVLVKILAATLPPVVDMPLIGPLDTSGALLTWGAFFAMLGLSVVLMGPVASAFIGLFIEEVAEDVESRHYPALPPLAEKPLGQSVEASLRFFALVVGANLAALALMVIPLFWPFAPFIFAGVNGYLLGREYFQMVALRRLAPAEARALYEAHKGKVIAAGVLMALPLAVPLVNLAVPVLGAATFTHLYHKIMQS